MVKSIRNLGLMLILVLDSINGFAQFDPAGGEVGSFAVHRNDQALVQWPTSAEVVLGPQDISDLSIGLVNSGAKDDVLGQPDNNCLSLGDGGKVILYFDPPIANQPGFDFAVFENGFSWSDSYFLELAFVEVSSDGKYFVRFPAISAADTNVQIENLAYMQPQWYFNLAGKHQTPYGTPFDLGSLQSSDSFNPNQVKYVKIVDVVGSLNDSFATFDSKGVKVNDPWPTGFISSGFDLDAVGVISGSLGVNRFTANITKIPNPISVGSWVNSEGIMWLDNNGKEVLTDENHAPSIPGIYVVIHQNQSLNISYRICVTP